MNVPILVGPTSSGKTSLALELCTKYDTHIISADSRQIYKFLDVGTGKLPINKTDFSILKGDGFWKINGVTIWGYDLVTPDSSYNVYNFAQFAWNKIEELHKQNIQAIVVGGTGLFVDTVSGILTLDAAESNPQLRQELSTKDLDQLLVQLKNLSATDFDKIDKKNKVRVVRSIERNLTKNTSEEKVIKPPQNIEFNYFGLTAERNYLYSRVDAWAMEIWGEKLFYEVEQLISMGYEQTPVLNGLVYKTAVAYLHGEIDFNSGLQRIQFDLHAYIRRQQTWFKKNPQINWLDVQNQPHAELVSIIGKCLYN